MKHPNAEIEALLSTLAHPKLATIDLSLERMAKLMQALGNPQDRLPPVIHVAGTNGKGSLLAYLKAILQEAGYNVHRYISPHLVKFNERIELAGKHISDDYLLELLKRVAVYMDTCPVTFFEATTALAFLAFHETPADIVLLETGLGGRLDATNLVKHPLLTAITPVSFDHKEYLGETITAIALEKAGIIKKNVICIVGEQFEEAGESIEHAANAVSAPLYLFGREWKVVQGKNNFQYISAKRSGLFPLPGLAGHHQIFNAATAIACMDNMANFTITDEHIKKGVASAKWPARLEHIDSGSLVKLLSEGTELWVDGGHNPAAGEILAAWVRQQTKPVHIICGMLKNKDTRAFLLPLAGHIKSLTAIPIEDEPLNQQPSVICDIGRGLGIKSNIAGNIKDCLKLIEKHENNDHIILICGSLYLAGNILWQNSQPL